MARQAQSTQSFVLVDQIKEGVVILKGGGMRALLKCSSLNFSLQSKDEQDAIVYEFQNFLNSLDFSVQIFINSRFLNIDDYVAMLEEREKIQQNDLLRVQTREYINFIKDFVQSTNIVSTDFYTVISFDQSEATGKADSKGGGPLSLFGIGKSPAKMERKEFLHYKNQLLQRVEFVKTGLNRMGITTILLPTEELIMLFWNLYNPQNLQKRTLMKSIFEKY
ncbi:MAG: hypothetical protein HYS15_00065 [Candidatus Spechtbacteria bacterium]|nr:hypothetical protein [Candidatus Spechtbacteria bacterium]